LHVRMGTKIQPPWPRSSERLTPHRAKCLLDARIIELGLGANQFGVKGPIFFRSVFHAISSSYAENGGRLIAASPEDRSVSFGSKAEVGLPDWRVGSALKNGHAATASACPFRATIGPQAIAQSSGNHTVK
jgi:hypothetical protein